MLDFKTSGATEEDGAVNGTVATMSISISCLQRFQAPSVNCDVNKATMLRTMHVYMPERAT